MSVEEMKKEAVKRINQLQNEKVIKNILTHLETLDDIEEKKLSADDVFKEAQRKYDKLLKKLA